MKKDKTKIVSLLLIFALLIFLIVQVLLIISSYESESRKFGLTTRQYVGGAFYQTRPDHKKIQQLSEKIITSFSADISGNAGSIKEELKLALRDYNNFGDTVSSIFRNNNIYIDFDYSILVSKYIVFDDNNKKQTIINNRLFNNGTVSLGTMKEILNTPFYNSFYYSGDNYYIEVNALMDYKNLTFYLLERIKYILFISFVSTLIIFLVFAYTVKTMIKQKKLAEMKSDFINNITHEFNTPLNTIKVAGANLKNCNAIEEPGNIDRLAGIILRQNSRLQRLIEDVLNASVLEREKLVLNYSIVDMCELVTTIAGDMQTNYIEKEIEFFVDSKGPIMAYADELQITTAIYNILDNAAKYSPEKSIVKIIVLEKDKYVSISVEDKGDGIRQEELKNIFDKFYRANPAKSIPVKGLGLGLYFVKKIIDAHSGKIEVESNPGAGTTFKIILPKQK